MNETLNTIYQRRAVRKFKEQAVAKEIIEQVIAAGRMAPSAINMQPWKFYVLTNKETIKTFGGAIKHGMVKGFLKSGIKQIITNIIGTLHMGHKTDFVQQDDMVFHGAPVVIFIASSKSNEWAPIDVGMCAQNMMLAAKSLGLDTCPIGMARYIEYTDTYEQLRIPMGEHVNLAIILGYGDETPEVHERITTNVTYID